MSLIRKKSPARDGTIHWIRKKDKAGKTIEEVKRVGIDAAERDLKIRQAKLTPAEISVGMKWQIDSTPLGSARRSGLL